MLNYKDYKVEDFVVDNFFRSWVLNPDRNSNVFWENWLANNQHKVGDVKKARGMLLGLSRLSYEPSLGLEEDIWNNIKNSITKEAEKDVVPLGPGSILARYPDTQPKSFKAYYAFAAVITLLIVASIVINFLAFVNDRQEEIIVTVTEKVNPKGQKSTVFLPDGSKVFLNSDSKISYDSRYNESDRIVKLEGEAFFEVAEDPSRPFTVVTEYMNTIALGTSFNVYAYSGGIQEVSLMTGKVKIVSNITQLQDVILYPGEMVVHKGERVMIKSKFDQDTKALWRNRIIYFNDTPFEEALETLERWYDVQFAVNGKKPKYKDLICTGSFENDYLSNVLQSLSYTLDFEYEIQGKRVLLTF